MVVFKTRVFLEQEQIEQIIIDHFSKLGAEIEGSIKFLKFDLGNSKYEITAQFNTYTAFESQIK